MEIDKNQREDFQKDMGSTSFFEDNMTCLIKQQSLPKKTKIAKEDLKQIQVSQSKMEAFVANSSAHEENSLFSQCLNSIKLGRYLEGHSLLTNFITKYSQSSRMGEALRHKANAEFNLAMYNESANTLIRLLSLRSCTSLPLHEILTDISRCFRMSGRIQEELEYLEKALEVFTDASITVKILYRIRNCYQKVCYLSPDVPYYAQFLSLYQLIVQDENGYLVLKPENLDQLGTLYEANLKLACAFTCYKLLLNTDSTNWLVWYKMGNVCMRLNRLHDGVKAFKQAVKCNTSSWEAFTSLAQAYEAIGESQEALSMYKHAYALNPLPTIAESIHSLSYESSFPKKQKIEKNEIESLEMLDFSYPFPSSDITQRQNSCSNSTLMVHFQNSDESDTSPNQEVYSLTESSVNLDSDKNNSPELTQKTVSVSPTVHPYEIQPHFQFRKPETNRVVQTISPPVTNFQPNEKSYDQMKTICLQEPITLIKNVESIGFDLSKFFSSCLATQVPDINVEGRTQIYQDLDENVENGIPTWNCTSKLRTMKIQAYSKYQNQFMDPKTMEEKMEKLKKGKSSIDFGTNIDMSDEKKWEPQLNEIKKLPQFLVFGSSEDMMSYYGFPVLGMNKPQLYMKVPGCRTPCHQENNNFCSVNINIGPDPCEWFAVEHKYWTQVESLCIRKRIEFAKGSWWPNLLDLDEAGIPIIRFKQLVGEAVFVNSGTLHWVQSLGVCNNVAWNIGPLTAQQHRLALERYYFNMKDEYKSIVPMETLSWKLTQFQQPSQDLYFSIRSFLIDSLNNQKDMESRLKKKRVTVVDFPAENSPVFYCCKCYKELFNYIFIRDGPTDREKSTYCESCWFTKIKSRKVICCRRKTIQELSLTLENYEKLYSV